MKLTTATYIVIFWMINQKNINTYIATIKHNLKKKEKIDINTIYLNNKKYYKIN